MTVGSYDDDGHDHMCMMLVSYVYDGLIITEAKKEDIIIIIISIISIIISLFLCVPLLRYHC